MAIETHGISIDDDVIPDLPFAEGRITQSGDGVDKDDLSRWLNRMAGRANAVIEGRDSLPAPSNIGENFRQLVIDYIIRGIRRRALEKQGGYPRDRIEAEANQEDKLLDALRTRDVDTGLDKDGAAVVRSNVDTSDTKSNMTFQGDPSEVF